MTTASTASVTTHSPFPAPARPHPVLTVLLLTLVTVAAYWQVGDAGFATHEDDAYLVHQPLVNQGLSPAGIVWAFTGSHSGNWHPLTTLSHMIDCEIFGLRPAPMHWVNVVWHVLNSALVFLVWRALTGATWRPAIVAALFALHPVHVESVAWISQRKEVLSAFFCLIMIGAYIGYARHRSIRRYLLVAGAMLLALLSKPVALTFPFALLLLDFWPLRRWPLARWRVLIIEKLPLFGLLVFHSVLSFLVQRASASYAEPFPFAARLGNVVVAYVRYLGKTFWPESLAPMYFPPDAWPAGTVAGAAVALVAASVSIWWLRRTRPWLTFGWLWFLGMLVPVIGLFQVGSRSMADRYMYVPILGLFTLIVWQFSRLVYVWPKVRAPLAVATVMWLLGFGVLTTRQVAAWKNSLALYAHSIAVGEDNAAVRFRLAGTLQATGRPEAEVVTQLQRTLERRPDYVPAITQLAMIAMEARRMDDAHKLIEQAVRLEPRNPDVHASLGAYGVRTGQPEEAIRHFKHVLALDPNSSRAHFELAQIYLDQNQDEAGRAHLEARARIERWNPDALADYGALLARLRRLTEARSYLERALWIRPDFPRARRELDLTMELMKPRG